MVRPSPSSSSGSRFHEVLRQHVDEKPSATLTRPQESTGEAEKKSHDGVKSDSSTCDQEDRPSYQGAPGADEEALSASMGASASPIPSKNDKGKVPPAKETASLPDPCAVSNLTAALAQASILAAATGQVTNPAPLPPSASAPGNELPIPGIPGQAPSLSSKEKKSAALFAKGSFIQSDQRDSSTSCDGRTSLAPSLSPVGNSVQNQDVTSNKNPRDSSIDSLAAATAKDAGIANVEREDVMNSTLNPPGVFSANGINSQAQAMQNAPDALGGANIVLSGNHGFERALSQVIEIARIAEQHSSRMPVRVAIEIQTAPGAVVNVYVSRQNDQWRAQLSTSDPQALSWVQDRMSALRQSTDFGNDIRWLPPQLENGGAYSRDGRSQGQPQRQVPERAKKIIAKTEPFHFSLMNTINQAGRVA